MEAWVRASLICAAVAAGNTDHSSAVAPVTKGAATLVPPSVSDWPPEPRLVMPSPGGHQAPPADGAAQIRLVHRSTTQVTTHHGDDPRMAGDGGTAEAPLLPAAATTITPRLTA